MIELQILGNLTKAPEGRTVNGANGQTQVAKFSVAANAHKGQEKITIFATCTAFGKQAETILRYAKKGDKIFAKGLPEIWVSQEGKAYLQMSVSFFEFAGGGGSHESDFHTERSAAPVRSADPLPEGAIDVTEQFLRSGTITPPAPEVPAEKQKLPWDNGDDNDLPF